MLYVALFLSFVVSYGHWGTITTYVFLASVLCLILPVLFFLRDDLPSQ